jgi:hypothetical protein
MNETEQHKNHLELKLRGKSTNIKRQVLNSSISEASRLITFQSFPTPISFPTRVYVLLLTYLGSGLRESYRSE